MNGNSRERSKYWRAEGFDDLELLSATYVTHTFDRHIHEGFALGVVLKGAEAFYYRGANHVAPAGKLVAINPGEIHTGQAVTRDGWTYRMIYPGMVLMRQIAREIFELHGRRLHTPYFPEPVIDDPTLSQQFRYLHAVLEHSTVTLERDTAVRDALSMFVLRHAKDRPLAYGQHDDRQAVRLAREYLDTHYDQNVSLETLAALSGISPFHLVRLFRAHMGLPPHTYLTHVRVMRAKALLAVGMPLAEVAQMVGFSDQSHLSRRFKRIVGIPPGHYARQLT